MVKRMLAALTQRARAHSVPSTHFRGFSSQSPAAPVLGDSVPSSGLFCHPKVYSLSFSLSLPTPMVQVMVAQRLKYFPCKIEDLSSITKPSVTVCSYTADVGVEMRGSLNCTCHPVGLLRWLTR